MADIYYADDEVFLDVSLNGEQQVGAEQHYKQRHELDEKLPTLASVERNALGAGGDVGRSGRRKLGHHPSHEAQQGKSHRPNKCRHPELAYPEVVQSIKTERLCNARTQRHTYSHDAREDVGCTAAFEKTEDYSPHAAQRKAVEEQGEDVVRRGQKTESHERQL